MRWWWWRRQRRRWWWWSDPLPTTAQSLTGGKESGLYGNCCRAAKAATMRRKGGTWEGKDGVRGEREGERVKEEEEEEEEGGEGCV